MDSLITLVSWCFTIYIFAIFVHILLSWFQLPYNPWLSKVRGWLYDTVEPYLRLFRGIIPPIGMFDISPIIAIIVLYVIRAIVISVLNGLA